MIKRFLSSMLVLLFFVGAASMFTSCKDYDDDIKNLQEQIDKNAKAIDQINSLVTDGSVISDVRKVADGIEVVMANGKIYTITNGTNATVWTIGDDGYWYKDGEKTNYYAIGKDGANGINGTNGTNGTNGKDGKDGIYYVPNPETGCWDIYNGDGTLKESTNISWRAANNEITAVKDGAELKLFNVRTSNGYENFSVALSNVLRGFVFEAKNYVDGVPAILIQSYEYHPMIEKNKNFKQDITKKIEEYSTSTDTKYKNKKTIVTYHVNPSNANVEDLQNLRFVVQANDPYYRTRAPKRGNATSDFDAEAKFVSFDNKTGIMKVEVLVHGLPATDEKISVIALQTTREDGENVTSDYATVYKDGNIADFHIADRARWNANPRNDYHFRRVIFSQDNCPKTGNEHPVYYNEDQDGESCDITMKWDDKNFRVKDYVMAHWYGNNCDGAQMSEITEMLGFTWKFELVKNFIIGSNGTDQAEYVDFDEETTLLTVKDKYGTSAIDRTPVIRVTVLDGNTVVKVAYIKVKIARMAEPMINLEETFVFGDAFAFHCNQDGYTVKYDYKDFSIQVLAKHNMSKDEFHTIYPKSYDINWTGDVGTVVEKIDWLDQTEEGTHVLEWTISNDDLWKYAGKTVTNRYRYMTAGEDYFFDIILSAKINDIQKTYDVNVNGNGKYVDNFWFDNYAYTKFNVNVPNPENTTDNTKCIFDVDMNTLFETANGAIKINTKNEFTMTGIHYFFCGAHTSMTIGGKNYSFSVNNNGTELWYGNHKIAWLENPTVNNKFTYNKNDNVAKQLLNTGDMKVYIGAKGLFCGKYEVNITFRGADHFVAKVLRPVTLAGNNKTDDYFIDGVDYGEAHSYVDCDKFLNRLVDWRDRDFANHPSFWEYYGPFSCNFHTNSAVCNLKVEGNNAWKPIPSTIDFRYEPSPWHGMNNRFGWLTYLNNGANVDEDFYIKVDLDINYGWGTYTIEGVEILVQSTKNTPAP